MLVVHFIGAQEVSREICSLALTSTTSYTPLSTKDLEIQPTRNNQKLWPIHLNMRFTIKCILSKITCMQSVLELFFRPHFGIISKNKICVTKFCNILTQFKMYFFINRNRQPLQCVFFTKYQVHTKLEKENCLASKQANLQFQRQFTQAIVNSYGLETGKSWGKLRVLLVSCISKDFKCFYMLSKSCGIAQYSMSVFLGHHQNIIPKIISQYATVYSSVFHSFFHENMFSLKQSEDIENMLIQKFPPLSEYCDSKTISIPHFIHTLINSIHIMQRS